MLNSTIQIVADHPVTIPPLLVTVWVVYQLLKRKSTKVRNIATGIAVILIVPVFVFSFLAEFTDHPFFHELSALLITVESWFIELLFRFIDAVLAAELQVVLLIVGGTWDALQRMISSAVPVMDTTEIFLTMFGFEFFAGAILIYTLYISSHGSNLDFALKGIGVVLMISGLFATLIQLDTWQVSKSLVVSAFMAAMLGFTLGIASMILLVRPNFGGEPMLQGFKASKLWSDKMDENLRKSWIVKTMSRLSQLVSKQRK